MSSSYAQNADTAVSSSFATNAISSSQAQNAVSASFAPMPDVSYFATTGSNNFVGQQNINGNVNVTGSFRATGQIRTIDDVVVSGTTFTDKIVNTRITSDITLEPTSGRKVILNGDTEVTGTLIVTNGITGSLEGSASFAENATSSSQSQNSVTSSYSDYAVSSSQSQNSVTSSYSDYAVTASFALNGGGGSIDTGSFATTGSNNFFGTENITGSLNVSGSALVKEGNLFLQTIHGTQNYNVITSSLDANANIFFNSPAVGNNISQSMQVSGSNNIVFGRPNLNITQYVHRIPSGSYNNIVNIVPQFNTGSIPNVNYRANVNLGTSVDRYEYSTGSFTGSTPNILNNYIAGTFQVNTNQSYRPIGIQNNNINGTLTYSINNANSYSTTSGSAASPSINNNLVNGVALISHTGFGVNTAMINNSINATQFTYSNGFNPTVTAGQVNLQSNNIAGGTIQVQLRGTGSFNQRFFTNNFVGGNQQIIGNNNDSLNSGSLVNSLIFGSNLNVTASHYDSNTLLGTNPNSTIMLGSYNELGLFADTTQTKFSVSTGTSSAARRTSLFVSSSGVFHVRSGMVQSGSLELVNNSTSGSMNLTGSLNVSGTLNVRGGGIVVSGAQIQTNGEIQFNGGTYFPQSMENFVKLNATSTTTLGIDNFNLNTPASQSLWTSTVDTGSNYTQQLAQVTNGGTTGRLELRNAGGVTTYTIDVEKTVVTGSIQGNVLPLTVSSNTASLNLDNGNFFELALTGSSDIRIEPSNIKPGQTVNLKLNTTGSGTVSFPSSVKQVSGSSYVPSTGTTTDIVTLVSFDSSNLYLANVKNLI